MKSIPLLLLCSSLPLLAGTSAKDAVAPAAVDPCVFTGFTGASVGYLTELEEPMYNVHLGTDTCWKLAGWSVALFAEVGYAQKDDDWSGRSARVVNNSPNFQSIVDQQYVVDDDYPDYEEDMTDLDGSVDDLESALSDISSTSPWDTSYDLDILPITLNVKLERPLTGNLNAYFGGGLGVARVGLDVDYGFGDYSDDDWVFTAQLFAGLNYNITPAFEVYGGARWIYFDDADLGGNTLELDDDFLFEIGGRFNF